MYFGNLGQHNICIEGVPSLQRDDCCIVQTRITDDDPCPLACDNRSSNMSYKLFCISINLLPRHCSFNLTLNVVSRTQFFLKVPVSLFQMYKDLSICPKNRNYPHHQTALSQKADHHQRGQVDFFSRIFHLGKNLLP